MSRPSWKPMIAYDHHTPSHSSGWSLDEHPESDRANHTLRVALEAQCAHTQRLHQQVYRLVNSVPLPALLYTRKGRLVHVNQEARALMTQIEWNKGRWQVDELWKRLGWPPVPFSQWEWNGGWLTCWDCPLDGPDLPSGLHVRYVRYEGKAPKQDPDTHLQRLAAIGEKTGRLAHDIRNPLSSLEWFATLLGRDDHPAPERRELADHLIQAVRSLDGLVSNLLLFSTPLQGVRQSVSISTLLDDVELLAQYPLRKKRLTIHRQVLSHPLEIKANESLLKQALLNLVLNAIHASPAEGCIEIHCRRSTCPVTGMPEQSGVNGITLTVRDEGCGMSEEELERAFQPFYSKRKGGTGLGLPIVKEIIQVHQGRIHICSHQGRGTTVDVFLPQ